jgi:hypothetical protein
VFTKRRRNAQNRVCRTDGRDEDCTGASVMRQHNLCTEFYDRFTAIRRSVTHAVDYRKTRYLVHRQ